MMRVPVPGGDLAVASWGPITGPVVLAAHGITSSHVFWQLVGEGLAAEGIRLLAPDLRGRGESAALGGPSSMARHAADLIAVMDHVGLSDAVVAGHSMGGFVAAMAAVNHPDRVRRVVLVDGGPALVDELPPDTDVEAVLGAIIGPSLERLETRFADQEAYRTFWRDHPAFVDVHERLVTAYADHDLVVASAEGEPSSEGWRSRVDRDLIIADARDTLDSDAVRTAVADSTVPVTFLYAERGMLDQPEGLYSPERVEALLGGLSNVDVRRVDGVNHFTIGMSPTGAAAVVDAVVQAVRG